MLKHFLNPPNWFTSASLFCGMYAIVLATGVQGEPNFVRAAVLILFAAVFDSLDGGVARLTGTGSDFGIQLDSLVDTVSFGIAPAILLYSWGVQSLGLAGLVVAFAFALTGIFRLARFNLQATGDKSAFSEGLTITMAGASVAALVMAHAALGRTVVEHPVNVLLVTVLLSYLMVSRVPFRTLKGMRIRGVWSLVVALLGGVFLLVAVRYRFSVSFVGLLGLYVLSGPIEGLFQLRRRLAQGPDDDTDDDL